MRKALILHTGAFIATERWNRTVLGLIDGAANQGLDILVPASVVAESWRQPSRPNASMLLDAGSVVPLERVSAQCVGILLGLAESAQVVDSCVAELALRHRPSLVLTADPADIRDLAIAAGYSSTIVASSDESIAKRVDAARSPSTEV